MKKSAHELFSIFRTYIENENEAQMTSWPELQQICEIKEYKKGNLIVREKQVFTYELFLAGGTFRSYLPTREDEQVNLNFYDAPQIVAPYFTRHINHEHITNFEALTPCTLILIDAEKFNRHMQKHYDLRSFAFAVLEQDARLKTRKEAIFISENASGRLAFFRENYPGLENKIPQHYIASYLGISPVSLSRLRSR